MTLEQKTTYEADGAALLIGDFKKPKIEALLKSYLGQAQEVEDALWQLYVDRRLANAVGVQLDVIGKIVGEVRKGRTDAVYRTWLGARILANRSNGRPEELIAIVKAVTPASTTVWVEEEFPAALTVHAVGAVDAETGNALAQLLALAARSAGVRLLFRWTSESAGAFRFSSAGWGGAETYGARGFGGAGLSAVSDGRPMTWTAKPHGLLRPYLKDCWDPSVSQSLSLNGAEIVNIQGLLRASTLVGNTQYGNQSRPTLGADGAYFGGENCIKSSGSFNQCLEGTVAPLLAAGSRPYVAMVARLPAKITASDALMVRFDKTYVGSAESHIQLNAKGAAGVESWKLYYRRTTAADAEAETGDIQDTAPHLFEFWADATLGLVLAIDGATLISDSSDADSMQTMGSQIDRVLIGQALQMSVRWLGFGTKPTDQARAAFRALCQSRWGTA